jgi:hypothetical protein
VVPIAVAAADATGTSVKAVLMVVAVAGCAALLTPISTPGNMMIMSPGGYRFGDYWKLGLPIMAWWFVVAMVVVPLVWAGGLGVAAAAGGGFGAAVGVAAADGARACVAGAESGAGEIWGSVRAALWRPPASALCAVAALGRSATTTWVTLTRTGTGGSVADVVEAAAFGCSPRGSGACACAAAATCGGGGSGGG